LRPPLNRDLSARFTDFRAFLASLTTQSYKRACRLLRAGAVSAVLTNNVVPVAMAPLLGETCAQARSRSVPAGAPCASNAGSVVTILGSPKTSWVDGTVSRIDRFRRIAAIETHMAMGP
jgi:Na+/H+ antiporter NhaD/arsenite permease-like protein